MWFITAKNEIQCSFCPAVIMPNETVAMASIKRKNGTHDLKLAHPNCFRKWQDDEFIRRQINWELSKIPRPGKKRQNHLKKRPGRKREFANPFLAARLRSLIHYHSKIAGHELKTQELALQLELLRKPAYDKKEVPDFGN